MNFRTTRLAGAAASLALLTSASVALADGGTTGADLQVSGSASTGSPNPGAALTYTFQVKNSGPDAATAVTLTNVLPAGTMYNFASVSGSLDPTQCGAINFDTVSNSVVVLNYGDMVVTCNLGTIAKGGQATVVVNLSAPVTVGTFSNTGTAASSAADPAPANYSVTVTVQVKTPSVDSIKVTKCFANDGGRRRPAPGRAHRGRWDDRSDRGPRAGAGDRAGSRAPDHARGA